MESSSKMVKNIQFSNNVQFCYEVSGEYNIISIAGVNAYGHAPEVHIVW